MKKLNQYNVVKDPTHDKGSVVCVEGGGVSSEPCPMPMSCKQADSIAKALRLAEVKGWNAALDNMKNFVEKNEYV